MGTTWCFANDMIHNREMMEWYKMAQEKPILLDAARLESALAAALYEHVPGTIQSLEVSVQDDQVLISGCTSRYYDQQLALAAVQKVLGSSSTMRISITFQDRRTCCAAPEGQDVTSRNDWQEMQRRKPNSYRRRSSSLLRTNRPD